jgi:uncharacterized protein (DUF1501 family)
VSPSQKSCGCREFSRAKLLETAAAQAGRGLPSIERGMPLPAGTGLSRRSFLWRSGGAVLSVYGASRLGFRQLQEGIARAAGSSDPVIVTIFLEGGIDGLTVLAPVNDAKYQQLRPTLKVAPGAGPAFAEDTSLHWHPSARALDTLHRAGKVGVMPAVSYHDPDQSHFTSRHYWEVGALDPNGRTGWMGRLLDRIGDADNPLQGLSLDGHLSPALAPQNVPVATVDGPQFDLWAPGVWGDVEDLMFSAFGRIGDAQQATGDPQLAGVGRIQSQAMNVRQQLKPFDTDGGITSPVTYPTSEDSFPRNLAALAAFLDAGLPIRCVAMNAPGSYDTHEQEPQYLDADFKLTTDTIAAFQADLEARGLADRVITLVWSEFGRRPEQNDSDGTDHGAAGVGFVIGTRAQGTMLGEFPGLAHLDQDDNLKFTMDFRAVYAAIIDQWFGDDPEAVIPDAGTFATLPQVIRSA